MSSPSDKQTEARVAWFEICPNPVCPVSQDRHLVIDRGEVPLQTGRAIALSYVWGEFAREYRFIGHLRDCNDEVKMQLGEDWILPEFIDALAKLGSGEQGIPKDLIPADLVRAGERNPIWIDQLCLPQRDEELPQALAKIPDIFRSFPVVILMSGSICSCVQEVLRELKSVLGDEKSGPNSEQIQKCLTRGKWCLGIGISSWIRRLWPREEFMFACRVACVWTSEIERQCRKGDDLPVQRDNLPASSRRMYDMFATDPIIQGSHKPPETFVRAYTRTAEVMMKKDFKYYTGARGGKSNVSLSRLHEDFYNFLLGKKVLDGGAFDSKDDYRAYRFLTRLAAEFGNQRGLHRSRRTATRSRDYILAIWPGCPLYQVPKEFQNMENADLMQEAVDQLRNNHGFGLGTTAPQGLFDITSTGSALWRPSEYLRKINPRYDMDFYRVVAPEGFAFGTCGTYVGINLRKERPPALSVGAKDIDVVIADIIEDCGLTTAPLIRTSNGFLPEFKLPFSTSEGVRRFASYIHMTHLCSGVPLQEPARRLVQLIHQIMRDWTPARVDAVVYATVLAWMEPWYTQGFGDFQNFGLPIERMRRIKKCVLLFTAHIHDEMIDEAYAEELGPQIEDEFVNLFEAIYIIVATALDLEPQFCEEKKVKLIFSTNNNAERPPRVGFCRGDVDLSEKTSENAITVCMNQHGPNKSGMLFEAEHVGTRDWEGIELPAYRVFAVWVPIQSINDNEYAARVVNTSHITESVGGQGGALLI